MRKKDPSRYPRRLLRRRYADVSGIPPAADVICAVCVFSSSKGQLHCAKAVKQRTMPPTNDDEQVGGGGEMRGATMIVERSNPKKLTHELAMIAVKSPVRYDRLEMRQT